MKRPDYRQTCSCHPKHCDSLRDALDAFGEEKCLSTEQSSKSLYNSIILAYLSGFPYLTTKTPNIPSSVAHIGAEASKKTKTWLIGIHGELKKRELK